MDRRVVTVFGASGFLGRHVVRRLARQGVVVRAAVRDVEAAAFLKTFGDVGQVVPMAIDVGDPALVELAVRDADAVINLVGILFEKGRRTFQRLHVEAAASVAKAAAAAGARRLVHVSAIGADQGSPSSYARTKGLGEAEVLRAFPDATILRPSVIFGPEDDFFNRFAGMTRVSPALPLFGGGATRLQPVYVGDVAEAVVVALGRPETRGRTYELGGPRIYTFRELMALVLSSIGRGRLLAPLPFAVGGVLGFFTEFLPKPPLTRDQLLLLRRDNVVSAGALTLADLDIQATPAEIVVPDYLVRYRPPRAKGVLAAR